MILHPLARFSSYMDDAAIGVNSSTKEVNKRLRRAKVSSALRERLVHISMTS